MFSNTSSQYSQETRPSRRSSLTPSPLNPRRLFNRNRQNNRDAYGEEMSTVSNGTWASTPVRNAYDPRQLPNIAYNATAPSTSRGEAATISRPADVGRPDQGPRVDPLRDNHRQTRTNRSQEAGLRAAAQKARPGHGRNKDLPAPPQAHRQQSGDVYFRFERVNPGEKSVSSTPSIPDASSGRQPAPEPMRSPGLVLRRAAQSFFSPWTTPTNTINENTSFAQGPVEQSKKKKKLCIFGVILAILVVIIVIVVPVTIVETHKKQYSPNRGTPTVTPTAAPTAINAGLPGKDLQVDTPLAPLAFVANTSDHGQSSGVQNYGIYYQNKCGNVKGVQNSGSWVPYGTAFTDSTNITGLSCVAFYNSSMEIHQTYCFYVGVDSHVRDKVLDPTDNTFEPASLLYQSVIVGEAPASALDGDPSSQPSDGYSLLALQSENWADVGAGVRLYHHASNKSGAFIQEHILNLSQNKWSIGASIGLGDVLPISKVVGTVDEQSGMARLMYASAGDNSTDADDSPKIQQWYLPLKNGTNPSSSSFSPSSPTWTRGQAFSGLLMHGSSSFALASSGGSSFLYHVTPLNSSGPALQIRELTMPGANSSDAIDMGAAQTVAVPDWLATDTASREATLYAPIAAVGVPGSISVFWAEGVVDALAGYDRLITVQRQLGDSWQPASYGNTPGQEQIRVDDQCVAPET